MAPAPQARTYVIAASLRRLVVDSSTGMVVMTKDPSAVLDFSWDWTAWLAANDDDEIDTFEVTLEERDLVEDEPEDLVELTLDSSSGDGAIVTAWLSGGVLEAELRVTCRIVTTGGRTDERSIWLQILEA